MLIPLNRKELHTRIRLNFSRLADDEYYRIGGVFSPMKYDWPGDKEGRALLAFVSHYKISGKKIPCMREMLSQMESHLNERRYLGRVYENLISEQQLSGHSWLLRGLCEHHEQFGDAYSLSLLNDITENLFLPTAGKYASYPIDRQTVNRGGVSGTELGNAGIWRLSTDVGCAFMAIDGLSHVYKITGDWRVRELLDEMIETFLRIDKAALRAQTHCTLSAARGMMRMYFDTADQTYLDGARQIWSLYVHGGGMTKTYQNLNWWGRPDSWTEPCAIVDSMMLSLELYRATDEECYRTMAARIWHNGLATAQRDNGGAGTDALLCENSPHTDLFAKTYEAPFCCTMRLAEGLWYADAHQALLWANTEGAPSRQSDGTYRDGDILYAAPSENLLPYAEGWVEVDGLRLCPIVKYYAVPKEILLSARQKIVFNS